MGADQFGMDVGLLMNVLSLFDGMSCGQIALNQLGFKIDNYFASEIEPASMKVAKHNFPNTIHIGDVTKVKGSELPKIDLLIGGSPCQGFSFAGKQLNFNDPRSALFFEFVRLFKETNPKYFLLENVRMKTEYQDVITEHLNWIEPIAINSSLVSAQNRNRLYWTNIPSIEQPKDKSIWLKDIFELNTDEKIYTEPYYKVNNKQLSYLGYVGNSPKQATKVFSTNGKSVCLTALGGGQGGKTGLYEIPDTRTCRKLTVTECEKLQTVPSGYTEGVSNTSRYKMLGNGWTVDVIKHIFRNMNEL
jgi:DNA-cytosine methyltransferase